MLEFVLALFFLVFVLFALIYKMYRSGLFDDVEVVLTDKPPVISRPMTIFYKHHIGAYKHAGNLFKEVVKLMPSDAITVGIYYDDSEVTKDHLLQSAVGVVYGEDGKDLYPANYAEQLTRWGYERMLMPAVERAVVATQNYESFLSIIALTQFTYSKLKSYVKRHNLHAPISVEFFTGKKIHVVMPLDHHSEFIIPQKYLKISRGERSARSPTKSALLDNVLRALKIGMVSDTESLKYSIETDGILFLSQLR